MSDVQPLFLFSLPRSGSTLLQRIIAAHSQVGSAAEPWVMLPLVYSLKREGTYSEYNHFQAARAIGDFCEELPNGQADYRRSIQQMVQTLYNGAAAPDTRYFLDKTPAYCMITQEIMEIFPNGKFVFLFRLPGAIAASMMETFNEGRWSLPAWRAYLYKGLAEMIATYQLYRSQTDRVAMVRYEDLLADPHTKCKEICEFLELDFEPEMTSKFSSVKFKGGMGDTTGRHIYQQVNKDPLEKWKRTLANPLRKRWYRSYLNWIGAERLEVMGYHLDEVLAEMSAAPSSGRFLLSDCHRMVRASLLDFVEPHMLRDKLKSSSKRGGVLRHY